MSQIKSHVSKIILLNLTITKQVSLLAIDVRLKLVLLKNAEVRQWLFILERLLKHRTPGVLYKLHYGIAYTYKAIYSTP